MTRIIIAYLITIVVFLGCDYVWLTQVGPSVYNPVLQPIMAHQPGLKAAAVFYLLYVGGLQYFAVWPGLVAGKWQTSLLKGALFGLFAYATYDLTNQATLIIWSSKITVLDIGWGMFVSGVSSAVACAVAGKFAKA